MYYIYFVFACPIVRDLQCGAIDESYFHLYAMHAFILHNIIPFAIVQEYKYAYKAEKNNNKIIIGKHLN